MERRVRVEIIRGIFKLKFNESEYYEIICYENNNVILFSHLFENYRGERQISGRCIHRVNFKADLQTQTILIYNNLETFKNFVAMNDIEGLKDYMEGCLSPRFLKIKRAN